MKYTKYEMGSYHLHTIQTNQFKTITIKVNFKREAKKEEVTMRNLLADLLVRSTEKYPTERLMSILVEDLYGINYSGYTITSGLYNIMSFDFTFLKDAYTEEGNLQKTLDFIMDILFHPHIENGKFTKENFELSKGSMQILIDGISEDPDRYAVTRLLEEMIPESPASYRSSGYKEDLEKITPKTLYDYYKTVIQTDLMDIFVIGDIDGHFKTEIEKRIQIHTFKKKSKSHYITGHKPRFRSKSITEVGPYNQSKLILGHTLTNMTPFEREYVAYIYSFILGGGADSNLFKVVREQHSLCYYIGSQIYRLSSLLLIQAGIDQKNAKETISLIKKEMKKMVQGKFSSEDIMKAQVTYISSLKEVQDSPASLLNLYVSSVYLHLDMIEKRIEMIGKVTKKDIEAFAKKIKLDTIYLLEGSIQNEEDNAI